MKFENLDDDESSVEEWSPLDDPDVSFTSSFNSRDSNQEFFEESISDAYKPDSFLEVPNERPLLTQTNCNSVRDIPITRYHSVIFKCKSVRTFGPSSHRYTNFNFEQ